MKAKGIIIAFVFLQFSCKDFSGSQESNDLNEKKALANEFVDAFYSFNSERLDKTLSDAKTSKPNILYYQKWAECGNYKVLNRSAIIEENDSTLVFPITVKDDLMAALDIDFNVTDTFRLTINESRIRSVSTSSNDPDFYYTAKDWVKENRNEFIEVPCEGIWVGGPTPCECIKGMIKGFGEFMEQEKSNGAEE